MRRFLSRMALLALALALFAGDQPRAAHLELPAFVAPQGRLVPAASSCSSAVPVLTADVPAATVICYVPAVGQLIAVNGAPYQFATLTLTLSQTNHSAGSNYDVWAVVSSGAPALCAEGSLWSSTTARSGTPAFSGGVLSNPSSLSHCYNGSTDHGSVAANAATYLGSFTVPSAAATTTSTTMTSSVTTLPLTAALKGAGLTANYYVAVDSGANLEYMLVTAGYGTTSETVTRAQLGTSAVAHSSGVAIAVAGGQTAMQFAPACQSGGNAPLLGVWNAYNRVLTASYDCDSANDWTYNSGTIRAADAGTLTQRITWIDGLQRSAVIASYSDYMWMASGISANIGIGLNSTTSTTAWMNSCGSGSTSQNCSITSPLGSAPLLGLNFVSANEKAGDGTVNFAGAGYGGSGFVFNAEM